MEYLSRVFSAIFPFVVILAVTKPPGLHDKECIEIFLIIRNHNHHNRSFIVDDRYTYVDISGTEHAC